MLDQPHCVFGPVGTPGVALETIDGVVHGGRSVPVIMERTLDRLPSTALVVRVRPVVFENGGDGNVKGKEPWLAHSSAPGNHRA